MAFTPTIVVSVTGKCTSLIITDTTGPDLGGGTGWDGIAGLTSGGATASTITITGPSGATSSTDVTSQITGASPITGNLEFTGISATWIDGSYDIRYSVNTGSGAVTTDFDFYVYCNVQACVDAMFAKLSTMACTTVTATADRDRLLANAQTADGLLTSLKSAIASSNTTAMNSLLARIQRICAFEGCTCSGCS